MTIPFPDVLPALAATAAACRVAWMTGERPDVRLDGWGWCVAGLAGLAAAGVVGLDGMPRTLQWLQQVLILPSAVAALCVGLARWLPAMLDSRQAVVVKLEQSRETAAALLAQLGGSRDAREDAARSAAAPAHPAAKPDSATLEAERLASLSELITGAAHELSNPLAIVSGYAELLAAQIEEEESREMLKCVVEGAFRCKQIVDNLASFVRRRPSEKHVVDVNRVLEDTLALREYNLRENQIHVAKDLAALPEMLADPRALQLAFFDQINWAYNLLRQGPSPRRLHLRTRFDQGKIQVDIRFRAARAHNGDTSEPSQECGTEGGSDGANLLAEPHFNAETVEWSDEPDGCRRCRIALEVAELGGESTQQPFRAGSALEGRRILLVDDEEVTGELCKDGLERLGCQIHLASGGVQALEMIDRNTYDLLISALELTDIGGRELLAHLSGRGSRLAKNAIIITGNHTISSARAAVEASGAIVLVKPFSLQYLEKTVLKTFERMASHEKATA